LVCLLFEEMEEVLTEKWGKFSLNGDENEGVSLDLEEIAPMVQRGRFCLIGKLLADRIVPKDFFKVPLLRAWRPKGTASFQVIGGNLFIVDLEYEEDKDRILAGRPWLFDGNLVSLAVFDGLTPLAKMNFDTEAFWVRMYNLPLECMGKETGQKIGASVGVVQEVDVEEDEPGWGEYLRVKILIDLSKPLARGRMLHVHKQSLWIAFKYEKLPKLCYQCSKIIHRNEGCSKVGSRRPSVHDDGQPAMLRVIFPMRRYAGSEKKSGTHRTQGEEGAHHSWRPNSEEGRKELVISQTGDSGRAEAKDGLGCNPGMQEQRLDMGKSSSVRQKSNEGDFLLLKQAEADFGTDQKEQLLGNRNLRLSDVIADVRDQEEINATEAYSKEKKEGGLNDVRKEREGKSYINEKFSTSGLFNTMPEESVDSEQKSNKNLAQRYVGQWNSDQNRMEWTSLKEGEEVLLERDPKSATYFPRVESRSDSLGTKDYMATPQKMELYEDKTNKSSECFSKVLVSETQSKSTQLASNKEVGDKATWKRKIRRTHSPVLSVNLDDGKEGKRKVEDSEEDTAKSQAKKRRKMEVVTSPQTEDQAVAGSQPRPQS
jgi:hypothetical protein